MINISYSAMNTYKESPLVFYYQYIKRAKPDTETVQCYGLAGSAVHESIERYIKTSTYVTSAVDPVEEFDRLWEKKRISEMLDFRGLPLNQDEYRQCVIEAKKIVDDATIKQGVLPSIMNTEVEFNFPIPEFPNYQLKGYVDVELTDGRNLILIDWKTNSSIRDGFEDQRKFYAYLYWKQNDVIPDKLVWYYLKLDEKEVSTFTESDMKQIEKEIFDFINEIDEKGDNIDLYPIGDITSPFNSHKKKCEAEAVRRQEALKYGIAIWGDKIKIVGDVDNTLRKALDTKFQYEKPGAYFIQKNTGWDGVVHLYNVRKDMIGTGFLHEVEKTLRNYGQYKKRPVEIVKKDMRDEPTRNVSLPAKLAGVTLRDYQYEAVNEFLKKRYGVIKLRTGLGKTLISAEIIRRCMTRTLFVINRKELVYQTRDVYEDRLGVDVGIVTEGAININNKEIVVCTYQTLVDHLDELREWLSGVGLLILDECHGAPAKSIKAICGFCRNTQYRLGLSATPFLRDDAMEVKDLIGDIVYEMDPDDNRNQEYLSEAEIVFVKLDDKKYVHSGEYHDAYHSYIYDNPIRNQAVVDIVDEHQEDKVLVLTKLVDHAHTLADAIGCGCITGKTPGKERDKLMERFRTEPDMTLVGSISIFSQGIDVPDINVLIQAAAPSGGVRTIQSIGRGLRKDGNSVLQYYDFFDRYDKYLSNAARNRWNLLKNDGHSLKVKEMDVQISSRVLKAFGQESLVEDNNNA